MRFMGDSVDERRAIRGAGRLLHGPSIACSMPTSIDFDARKASPAIVRERPRPCP